MTGLIILILAVVIVTAVINSLTGANRNLFFTIVLTYLLVADWCVFTPVNNLLTGVNKPSIVEAAYSDLSTFVDETVNDYEEKRKMKKLIEKCFNSNIKTTLSTPRGLNDWCKYKAKKSLK